MAFWNNKSKASLPTAKGKVEVVESDIRKIKLTLGKKEHDLLEEAKLIRKFEALMKELDAQEHILSEGLHEIRNLIAEGEQYDPNEQPKKFFSPILKAIMVGNKMKQALKIAKDSSDRLYYGFVNTAHDTEFEKEVSGYMWRVRDYLHHFEGYFRPLEDYYTNVLHALQTRIINKKIREVEAEIIKERWAEFKDKPS
jgi:hypothetical protein